MKLLGAFALFLAVTNVNGFNFGSGGKSAAKSATAGLVAMPEGEPELPMKKTDDNFLRVQMHAIKAYKLFRSEKSWNCSYEDHAKLHAHIPTVNDVEADDVFQSLADSLEKHPSNVVVGAEAVANATLHGSVDLLLLWDSVYINTLQYYNVFYGGYVYKHVGLGTAFPSSFYKITDELLYFDLVACLPFVEFVNISREHNIKDIMRVPANAKLELRNAVGGVVGLLNFPINQTKPIQVAALQSKLAENVVYNEYDECVEPEPLLE